ncbi:MULTISPECIES: hypothetical protein [Corynebacterium]|uniref:Uncharacterized protein n=1 Tax=Corynebacterium ihumii TaxID=1232427 RepID=A0ABY7UAG1_9CORY|nr:MULTISPECIES: hypothetical protein [Corynebacterium]WCZ33668.1 hypothetical protein CIHUM_01105 [Corynebacterium ihumii]
MTTPNIELIMPTTTLFTGREGSGQYLRIDGGLNYVYLPMGASLVQIVATGMKDARIRIDLVKSGGNSTALKLHTVAAETERIFTDTFANANSQSSGMWIRMWCYGLTADQAATGTVGVTITPLQFE